MTSPYVTPTLVDTHANLPAVAANNHVAIVANDDGAGHGAIYRGNGTSWVSILIGVATLYGGGTANRVIGTADGTNVAWTTVSAAAIAPGGANTVLWTDGALATSWSGSPIVSTSLQVRTDAPRTVIRDLVGSATTAALYMGNVTPDATNFAFTSDGSNNTGINAPSASGRITFAHANSLTAQISPAASVNVGFRFAAGFATPLFGQVTQTADVNGTDLTVQSQAPLVGSTNRAPGNLIYNTPAPTGTGAVGVHRFQSRGVNQVQMGEYARTPTFGTIWLGNTAAAFDNWSISGNGSQVLELAIKSATGFFGFMTDTANGPVAGDGYFTAIVGRSASENYLQFGDQATAAAVPAIIKMFQRSTNTAVADLTIEGMAPSATATLTNRNSGNVVVNIPAPTTGGAYGLSKFSFGGVPLVWIGNPSASPSSASPGYLFLGGTTPVFAANYALLGDPVVGQTIVNASGGSSGGIVRFSISNNVVWEVRSTLLQAASGQAALITHAQRTGDNPTFDLTMRSQAPSVGASPGNQDSGNIVVDIAAPVGAGVHGKSKFSFGGTVHAQFWPHPQFPTLVSALYLGPGVVPGNTNFSLATNISGQSTLVNAPSGQVLLTIANVTALSVQSLTKVGFFSNAITMSTGGAAPVSTENGGSLYVQQGAGTEDIFFRKAGAWISLLTGGSGFVPTSRQIIAGAGLTGGGDLSADRTINVAAADGSITVNADSIQVGVISDAQHGNRGGGALHPAVTNAAAGFAPAITAANRVLLSASTSSSWQQLSLDGAAIALGSTNTVLWSSGAANSWTGSPILSTSLAIGTNAASSGALRVTTTNGLFGRNAANSINITIAATDANDRVVIGTSATAVRISTLGPGVVHSDDAFGTLSSSSIIGADIANATITTNKLSPGTNGQVIMTNGTPAAAWTTYAGDVTGTPAASTVVGLTGVANITTQHGTTITTPNTEQIFEQTGDSLGASRIRVRNRSAMSGLVVENTVLDVIDIRYIGSSIASNIRYEGRGGQMRTGGSEFQIGTAGNPTLSVGTANSLLWLSNTASPAIDVRPASGGWVYEVGGTLYHRSPGNHTTTLGANGVSGSEDHSTFIDRRMGECFTGGTASAAIVDIDFADYGFVTGSGNQYLFILEYTVTCMDLSSGGNPVHTFKKITSGSLVDAGGPSLNVWGNDSAVHSASSGEITSPAFGVNINGLVLPFTSRWQILVGATSGTNTYHWFAKVEIWIVNRT